MFVRPRKGEKSCDVYAVINITESVANVDKCDVVETQLKQLWHDKNDCAGVYCASSNSSTGNFVCKDRLRYYECVDETGKAVISKQFSRKFYVNKILEVYTISPLLLLSQIWLVDLFCGEIGR